MNTRTVASCLFGGCQHSQLVSSSEGDCHGRRLGGGQNDLVGRPLFANNVNLLASRLEESGRSLPMALSVACVAPALRKDRLGMGGVVAAQIVGVALQDLLSETFVVAAAVQGASQDKFTQRGVPR